VTTGKKIALGVGGTLVAMYLFAWRQGGSRTCREHDSSARMFLVHAVNADRAWERHAATAGYERPATDELRKARDEFIDKCRKFADADRCSREAKLIEADPEHAAARSWCD
jgi:hypothetical protein